MSDAYGWCSGIKACARGEYLAGRSFMIETIDRPRAFGGCCTFGVSDLEARRNGNPLDLPTEQDVGSLSP
jgi:hypothetical protein